MKNIIILIIVGCVGFFGYQKFFSNTLYGKYEIDINAMEAQIASANMPSDLVEPLKKAIRRMDTKMTIEKSKITMSMYGKAVDFPYEKLSTNGNCTKIKIGNEEPSDYCLKNNTLEIITPSKPGKAIFRRI